MFQHYKPNKHGGCRGRFTTVISYTQNMRSPHSSCFSHSAHCHRFPLTCAHVDEHTSETTEKCFDSSFWKVQTNIRLTLYISFMHEHKWFPWTFKRQLNLLSLSKKKRENIQSSLAVINNLSFCKCRVAATGQQCRASPNGVHAVLYINLSSSLTFHWGILIFAQPAGNKLKTKKQSWVKQLLLSP